MVRGAEILLSTALPDYRQYDHDREGCLLPKITPPGGDHLGVSGPFCDRPPGPGVTIDQLVCEAALLQPLKGSLRDEGRKTAVVSGRGQGEGDTVHQQLTEGHGSGQDCVMELPTHGRGHLSGSSIDPEWGRRFLGDLDDGGAVEDGGSDTEPPPRGGYHPAQCISRIPGWTWDGNRFS